MERLQPRFKKGQSTLEIALMIAVVCAALIAMAPALGRRVKGYVQSNSSSISQQAWGNSAQMNVVSNSVSDSYSDSDTSRTNSDSDSTQDFSVGDYQ